MEPDRDIQPFVLGGSFSGASIPDSHGPDSYGGEQATR
jgi:hypothetical protein